MFNDPKVGKLVRSTAAALPLVPDPWSALAAGLFMAREDLCRMIDRLSAEGILLGAWGEPNPAAGEMEEDLVCGADVEARVAAGGWVRWRGVDPRGELWASVAARRSAACSAGETAGARYLKLGIPLPEGNPLAAAQERTLLVMNDPAEGIPALSDEERYIAASLYIPRPITVRADFWRQLADQSAGDPVAVREAARRLIYTRAWRRLAFRFSLSRLGFAGCGLASWRMDEGGDALEAGRALAALSCTGDVAIRDRSSGPSVSLAALIVGRAPGEGEAAAAEIARQWQRPLASWVPLDVI